jgi:hypothetical protein
MLAVVIGLSGGLFGCTNRHSGAVVGAGVGAVAGQAIGGDTKSTVAGAVIGAGVGYELGKEAERTNRGP